MSDNISQIQEVDVLKKKLALLIKGLKEEKHLTTKLKEENELLKYDLEEKKLLLKKTKEEYQELLQSKTSPEKLSTYFNTLENQENCEGPDIEKFKLRKESTEFKNKINTLEEDNKKLLAEIEKIKKNKELEITILKNELLSLKNQLASYKDSMLQSQEKSSKLINNIQMEKVMSNDKDTKISKLQSENEALISDNNTLKKQNGYFMQIIEQLKNQIENKGKENFYLEKEMDDNKIIKIDEYIFKGYIIKMSKWLITDWNTIKKNINIFFGRKAFYVSVEMNGKSFDIIIDDILKIDYYNENKKKIKFVIDGEGKEDIKKALNVSVRKNKNKNNNNNDDNTDAIFVCSFTEKECKYILKFYNEMKTKYNKECGGLINSSINAAFLD
jgi:hypothetical protein